MCGFICIFVGEWELAGIFSVRGRCQVFISKQEVTLNTAGNAEIIEGGDQGVMHLLVLQLHSCVAEGSCSY